jgi:hypothetical protein
MNPNGPFVNNADITERAEKIAAASLPGPEYIYGKAHRVGCQRLAVMKSYPFPQGELERSVFSNPVGLSQAGHELSAGGVSVYERVRPVVTEKKGLTGGGSGLAERIEVVLHSHYQSVVSAFGCGDMSEGERQDQGEEKQALSHYGLLRACHSK